MTENFLLILAHLIRVTYDVDSTQELQKYPSAFIRKQMVHSSKSFVRTCLRRVSQVRVIGQIVLIFGNDGRYLFVDYAHGMWSAFVVSWCPAIFSSPWNQKSNVLLSRRKCSFCTVSFTDFISQGCVTSCSVLPPGNFLAGGVLLASMVKEGLDVARMYLENLWWRGENFPGSPLPPDFQFPAIKQEFFLMMGVKKAQNYQFPR